MIYNKNNITSMSFIRPIFIDEYKETLQKIMAEEPKQLLFQAFCGIGKTRVIHKLVNDTFDKFNLTVLLFPSLNLVNQYYKDYITNNVYGFNNNIFDIQIICSSQKERKDKHPDIKYTTNKKNITKTIKSSSKKLLCITYQSFPSLHNILKENDKKIDLLILDEAHHCVGNIIQTSIFDDRVHDNSIFFTATPVSRNGIDMYSLLEQTANIKYMDGINAEHLDNFEIISSIINNTTDTQKHIIQNYNIITENIISTGNSRVLTFHRYVNNKEEDHDYQNYIEEKQDYEQDYQKQLISVKEFVKYKKVFFKIFKQKSIGTQYEGCQINLEFLDGSTKRDKKEEIITSFENTTQNNVYIISSCRTIGEGVDTKNANHIVFVDSKKSIVDIIQNIGRCVRKNGSISTITIPTSIDYERYKNCSNEQEKDSIIRQGMVEHGDFNTILNVVSAIKQEDEEYFELCLRYPNKLAPKEVLRNFKSQGFQVQEETKTNDITTLFENSDRQEQETDTEFLNRMAEENQETIEIINNDLDNNILILENSMIISKQEFITMRRIIHIH